MATKFQFNDTTDNYKTMNSTGDWLCQTFTPETTHRLSSVYIFTCRQGSVGNAIVDIYAVDGNGKPTGSIIATGNNASTPLCNAGDYTVITMSSNPVLSAGTQYAIVYRNDNYSVSTIRWTHNNNVSVYERGESWHSENNGSSWAAYGGDFAFQEWGTSIFPTDMLIVKRLCAAAGDSIYYEDSPGSQILLADSSGDLDTTQQTMMVEAFQKAVIANGTNLKIVDFFNTRLDLGVGNELTQPPWKGDVLTQASTEAVMIVDHVDSTMRYIYGHTITDFVFDDSNNITSNDAIGEMAPATIVADVVEEASSTPLYYDYEVYPDVILSSENYGQVAGATKSSGEMPTNASIICLYRGRIVLAGDFRYPHQWYMSRQANIFDYGYIANDAQTPVVGNNTDAGEIGDIIKAVIPYKDDFLIFGCQDSMWVMRGDPAAGGTLSELDLTVGIYGAYAHCFDSNGSFFFWGTNGIYVVPPGLNVVKSLTENTLPNIIKDEDLDPSTHRVTLGYDRVRRGILVSITVLLTGVNSEYWYDLRTGGFFPESYPTNASVYSQFFYASNATEDTDLLFGCRDGFVRRFSDSAKSDNNGASNVAIDSYVALPVIPIGPEDDWKGLLHSLLLTLAGGGVGGGQADSDAVTYNLYSGDSAEECLEKILDGDTPQETGTLTGPGRKWKVRKRISGRYLGIMLQNSTLDQVWAIEKVEGDVVPKGRK